jgi:hypothetical protein
MRYLIVFVLAFPLMMMARENPFAPAQSVDVKQETDQNLTSSAAIQAVEPQIHPQRLAFEKEIVNYGKARFVFRENSVYIETKDRLMKHFLIKNPPSIVIDFESPSDFPSKRKELMTKPFIKLEMGAHSDHYRVVLRLDQVHKYTVSQRKYGQLVTISD